MTQDNYMAESEKLLIEIAKCPNFLGCENTACEEIVGFQRKLNLQYKQVPEPWNGDIVNSKILFISSNPSINENELFPLENWPDSQIIDFFQNRFSLSGNYVKNYLYPKHIKENEYAENWIRYWGFIRSIARKLLDTWDVVPGSDYAMMEIVRCKSHHETGVNAALDICAEKYLARTLAISKAKVIVAVGDKSRDMLAKKLGIDFIENSHIEVLIQGVKRIIFSTPHSNARKKRNLESIISLESMNYLKDSLRC